MYGGVPATSPRTGQRSVFVHGQAEVGDMRAVMHVQKNVRGFQVAMDQTLLMANERASAIAMSISALAFGVSRFLSRCAISGPAFDVLEHDETTDFPVAIDLKDRDDAGVLDPGGQPRLRGNARRPPGPRNCPAVEP